MLRLGLFDDSVDAFAFRRVQDPAATQPEGDVRRMCFAVLGVGDEITRAHVGFVDGRARVLLLIRVARDQAGDMAVRDVDQPRTVDAAVGQAAPEVRRTEVAPRLRNWIAADAGDLVFAHPAGIVVGGANTSPALAALFDRNRLSAQQLGHPLGVVARCSADSGDVDGAEDVHGGRV